MSALPWSTNESRALWRKRVESRSWVYGQTTGEVYVCPRCGWESNPPMRWREGALRLGMIHDLRCGARVKVVA